MKLHLVESPVIYVFTLNFKARDQRKISFKFPRYGLRMSF